MTSERVQVSEARVRVAAGTLEQIAPVLRQIGAYLQAESTRAFRMQGRSGPRAWAARMTPNIPGIVDDLNKGGAIKARRFQARPALVDTGQLRRSISFSTTPRTVTIGTVVPYAAIHQTGGTRRVQFRAGGRRSLAKFLRSSRGKRWRDDLGWLFARPNFEVRVRKRPFLSVEPKDLRWIARLVASQLDDRRRPPPGGRRGRT